MFASGVPLKLSGEEPASIGDVTLCDDTPIKRSGVVSAGAATGRTGRRAARRLAGGGAQPEPAVDPDNDRERARHPRGRPSRDTTGEVRFDRSLENDWHTVYVDGAPRLGFQLTLNHVASDWPDGEPQRLHLDLYVDDIAAGHAEVMALGAHLLKPAAHPEGVEGFQVYADPLGASILPLLGLNGTGAALHLCARE